MQRVCLAILLSLTSLFCSKEDLALNGQLVKAQVLHRSCIGTTLQWVDAPASKGRDWLWFTNLDAPLDKANPAKVYPHCVSAFDIPADRQVPGDTLQFMYEELDRPSGLVCALGGSPTIYISVRHLTSK